MIQSMEFSRIDTSALLRIVGSRKGADFDAIVTFEQSHHRRPPTAEQIRNSVARLIAAGYVVQQGNQYFGVPELTNAFFDEVRNCRDTVEELDVLNRVLARVAPPVASED